LAFDLLHVKADACLLPFAIDIAEALLNAHPTDTALCTDYGFGQRWCRWLDALLVADPAALDVAAPTTPRVHTLLGRLANIGIPEAADLERRLPQ
jgi:hypothetical protein